MSSKYTNVGVKIITTLLLWFSCRSEAQFYMSLPGSAFLKLFSFPSFLSSSLPSVPRFIATQSRAPIETLFRSCSFAFFPLPLSRQEHSRKLGAKLVFSEAIAPFMREFTQHAWAQPQARSPLG